jgi:hypothetical protein
MGHAGSMVLQDGIWMSQVSLLKNGIWRNSVISVLWLAFVLPGAGCIHTRSRQHDDVAPANIQIERPENNGSVNILPCTIIFSDGQRCELLGGDQAVVLVRPGALWVAAYSRDPYRPDSVDSTAWRSLRFRFHVGSGQIFQLSVEPKSKGSAYTGGWLIEHAASNVAQRRPSH